MANGIDIVIGAEVSGALQGLQKVEAATVKAGATINKLPVNVSKATQSLSKLPAASNQATSALINLGRVAQDAPFGIIGIANNLNPLLESFQRTSQAAGGFVGTLKALGGALLGGGGIGFLLSLVTGAMSYFAMGSRSATKETKELDEAAQKAAEAQQQFQKALDAASSATVSQAGEIANLRSILIDTGTTLEQLTQSTLNQALAQYLFTQKREVLEKVIAERLNQQLKIAQNTGENLGNYKFQLEEAAKVGPIRLATDDDFRKTGKFLTDTEKKLLDINSLARVLGIDLTGAFDRAFNKNKATPDKVEVKPKRVVIDFNQTVVDKQIDNLLKYMFDKDVKFDFIAPILIPPDEVKRQATEVSEIFSKEFSQYTGKTKIDLGLDKAIADSKAKEAFNKSIQDVVDSGLENIKVEGLSSLGEAIGTALSGGDLSGVFSNFLGTLGSGIQSIGKQIIALSATAKAVKAALRTIFTNPAAAIIAGVGLIAVGSAIKGIASKGIAGARAMGGPVSAGRTYLVGEREPELFVPSQNGRILNGNQIAAMSYSGGGSSGGGRQIVRGQNIILAYARTNRAQNRLGRG